MVLALADNGQHSMADNDNITTELGGLQYVGLRLVHVVLVHVVLALADNGQHSMADNDNICSLVFDGKKQLVT